MQAHYSEAVLDADWAAHCAAIPTAEPDLQRAAETGDTAALPGRAGEGIGKPLPKGRRVIPPTHQASGPGIGPWRFADTIPIDALDRDPFPIYTRPECH